MSGEGESLHAAIRDAADPMIIMTRVVEQALLLVDPADGAAVELLDDHGALEYVAASGVLRPHLGLRLPAAGSLSGQAARTATILRCDDANDDPRVDAEACRRTGVRSMLCVPLVRSRQGIGVLKVSSCTPHAFVDEDASTLARLAEFIGVVIAAAADMTRVMGSLFADGGNPPSAGAALHQARQRSAGLSQFVANVLTPGMVEDVEARERIRALLDARDLTVVAQPIVNLRTGTAVGVEALSRFQATPVRPPNLWFAEAHTVGLGVELELAAVEKSLDLLRSLPDHLYVAVNVSPATIRDQRLTRTLAAAQPSRVMLEVTEHDEIEDYQTLRDSLAPLRYAGMRLAIDDTGAGYASLAHILRLAPDVIKLDRDLTRGIDLDPVRRALATSLVTFATETGSMITAEGIETADEAVALQAMGINHGQGYYLGRPSPLTDLRLQFPQLPDRTRATAGRG